MIRERFGGGYQIRCVYHGGLWRCEVQTGVGTVLHTTQPRPDRAAAEADGREWLKWSRDHWSGVRFGQPLEFPEDSP